MNNAGWERIGMQEIRRRAREIMKGYCHVCQSCDGKNCTGQVPGMGGAGSGASFRRNVEAVENVKLNMRVVHDVTAVNLETELLGRPLAMPVLAAPMGGVDFNMGGGMTEEDFALAILGGCADQGILGGTADGVPDFVYQAGFRVIKSLDGRGVPCIKPWGDEELLRKLDEAAKTGAKIVGVDIDSAGLITLSLMGRPVSPRPAAGWRPIIERTPMKFILKGVMSVEDALEAVEAGADGIVVSNHGGRAFEHTPGTAEVLPRVAEAVKGRIAVLADGGVRSGGDVLKMLGLGADAVLIGRPLAVAAMGGGREGVVKYLERIKLELTQAMVLTACADIRAVGEHILT